MSNVEYTQALRELTDEKGISLSVLSEKLKIALAIAVKKDYPLCEQYDIEVDLERGKFSIVLLKEVVDKDNLETPIDENNQITLEKALRHGKYQTGDMCRIVLDNSTFGRVSAQAAKQVMKQGVREAEKDILLEQWGELQGKAATVTVSKFDPSTGNITVDLSGTEVILFRNEQIPNERLHVGDMIKVFVSGVSTDDKRPMLKISRKCNELIRELFRLEAPEVEDGTVEIKAISREPGIRAKVAVISNDENVEAVGTCIGKRRQRIANVSRELCGEKLDIIDWYEDTAEFIKQSLKPAEVIDVTITDEELHECAVIVPDNQLSLAIGVKGLNARLAARITGFKIDIKPESGSWEDDSGETAEDYDADNNSETQTAETAQAEQDEPSRLSENNTDE
jgi:N utilization substance protein A